MHAVEPSPRTIDPAPRRAGFPTGLGGVVLPIALGLAALGGVVGAIVGSAVAIALGVFAPATAAAVFDLRERRLPDVLVASTALPCVTLAGVALADGDTQLRSMALGAGLAAVPLLVLHLVSPAAMGFGDVKLAAPLGAFVGLFDVRLPLLMLAVAAGATAVVALLGHRRHAPFGPGLVAAAALVLALASVHAGDVELVTGTSPWP